MECRKDSHSWRITHYTPLVGKEHLLTMTVELKCKKCGLMVAGHLRTPTD